MVGVKTNMQTTTGNAKSSQITGEELFPAIQTRNIKRDKQKERQEKHKPPQTSPQQQIGVVRLYLPQNLPTMKQETPNKNKKGGVR